MSDVKNSSLATNLGSYWELEEASGTRVDSHGSNDLTDVNTVGTATGIQGNGADFERSNTEYLISSTGPGITGDWSISFWLKQESQTINQWPITSYTSGEGGILLRVNSDGKLFAQFGNGGTVSKTVTTASQITIGSWYHVVFTSDVSAGTNGYTVYVNGSSVALTADTSTATSVGAQANMTIGALGAGTQPFDGVIDEVGIWSRILSASDVTTLYNSGAGIPYDAGGATNAVKSINGISNV